MLKLPPRLPSVLGGHLVLAAITTLQLEKDHMNAMLKSLEGFAGTHTGIRVVKQDRGW